MSTARHERGPVLVTGATGLLGTHFVRHLNGAGVTPRVLLRREVPDEAWGGLRVVPARGDLAAAGEDGAPLAEALRDVDTVFHLAAYVNVGRKNRRRHEEVNFRGAVALHRAAARAGVRRFVHVSSIAAVGGSEDGTPLDESAPWNLASFCTPYFDTKRSAEEYMLDGERGSTGPETVVVNPSIMLGELKAVRGRLSALAAGREPPVRAVAGIPPSARLLRLFLFRPPVAINLVDADNVARGLLLAAERGEPGRRYLLTGHNLDWPGIARAVRPWVPLGPPLIPIPHALLRGTARLATVASRLTGRRAKWTVDRARLAALHWHYSPARAERELGWDRTPLERTLEKILGAP